MCLAVGSSFVPNSGERSVAALKRIRFFRSGKKPDKWRRNMGGEETRPRLFVGYGDNLTSPLGAR